MACDDTTPTALDPCADLVALYRAIIALSTGQATVEVEMNDRRVEYSIASLTQMRALYSVMWAANPTCVAANNLPDLSVAAEAAAEAAAASASKFRGKVRNQNRGGC